MESLQTHFNGKRLSSFIGSGSKCDYADFALKRKSNINIIACRKVIELLASNSLEVSAEKSDLDEADRNNAFEESFNDEGEADELSERRLFKKPADMLFNWIEAVELSTSTPEESGQSIRDAPSSEDFDVEVDVPPATTKKQVLFQLPDYKKFVQQSNAYQWLISRIRQHSRLAFGDPNLMFDIGASIRNQLRVEESLRRLSRRRPPTLVSMTINLDWNPIHFVQDQGLASPSSDVLGKVLCLSGSWDEAQATTVMEYIEQTWPITGEPIISLLHELISLPEGQECTCKL